MTRWLVPPLRRTVQLLSLVVLVGLPLLSLYAHYKSARAIADLPQDQWQSAAVRGVDWLVDDNPARLRAVENTQGTFWSARILGVSLTDPLAGLEAVVTSRSFYLPLLWSLLIPVVASVLLGRVFCGWICPMNTLLELVDKGRGVLRLLEVRPRDVKFSLANKYVILALALLVAAVAGMPFLAMIYPPAVLSREAHLIVFGSAAGVGLYLILAICALELFVSKRWWCRYVCPGGAVYSLLGRFRLIRVRRDADKCTRCGDCVRACQFDLRPMLVEVTGMECTNCAACISGCPTGALRYGVTLPISPRNRSRDQQEENNSNGEHTPNAPTKTAATAKMTITIAALACVLLMPQIAVAHHILGLPHYSYKENYPQAPTLEYPATTGPYDVLMTSYPGKPVPGEAATVAFYIKNRHTGEPYNQPVTMQVLQTFTFGASRVIREPATHQPFDNQHKYTVVFPEDGEYVVELTMQVEGRQEVIPFLVVAGDPSATASVLVVVGGGLAMFLVVVRAVKIKRTRRKAQRLQKEQTAVSH